MPNRLLVLERLDAALRASEHTTACVGLILCDIDGFKAINDEHGHGTGDEVLVEVGHRMRAALRPEDVVGRLGGDEMLILTVRDAAAEVRSALATAVAAAEAPIATVCGSITLRMSAGCAVADPGARPGASAAHLRPLIADGCALRGADGTSATESI